MKGEILVGGRLFVFRGHASAERLTPDTTQQRYGAAGRQSVRGRLGTWQSYRYGEMIGTPL